tara:strand:+ start:594 stop:1772 length:1179 start_codon:yes stop_codon:yes gene_type:complete
VNKFCEFLNDRTDIQKILTLALSADKSDKKIDLFKSLLLNVDVNELYKEAKVDEVDSHIADMMMNSGIKLEGIWQNSYNSVNVEITNLMNEIDRIALELSKNKIKIVALKNAGIARCIYTNYASSPMGDIDLLISAKDFYGAHQLILEKLGYTFKFRSNFEDENIDDAFRGGGTEYYKVVDGYKVWLELQWRPIAGRWIQPENEPNGDMLINNSIEVQGSNIRILNPEDNLLQVSLHTAKHSYVRAPGFRLHSDVDRVVRFQKIDWQIFVNKVINLRIKTAVYFSLFFAKELLNTPIPEFVFDKLNPSWYRKIIIFSFIKKAGIFNQKKKKFSKIGYILFNLLLYDTLMQNFKAIFPSYDSIKIKYPIRNKLQLPYFYILRIKDLIFKRAKL